MKYEANVNFLGQICVLNVFSCKKIRAPAFAEALCSADEIPLITKIGSHRSMTSSLPL